MCLRGALRALQALMSLNSMTYPVLGVRPSWRVPPSFWTRSPGIKRRRRVTSVSRGSLTCVCSALSPFVGAWLVPVRHLLYRHGFVGGLSPVPELRQELCVGPIARTETSPETADGLAEVHTRWHAFQSLACGAAGCPLRSRTIALPRGTFRISI